MSTITQWAIGDVSAIIWCINPSTTHYEDPAIGEQIRSKLCCDVGLGRVKFLATEALSVCVQVTKRGILCVRVTKVTLGLAWLENDHHHMIVTAERRVNVVSSTKLIYCTCIPDWSIYGGELGEWDD